MIEYYRYLLKISSDKVNYGYVSYISKHMNPWLIKITSFKSGALRLSEQEVKAIIESRKRYFLFKTRRVFDI
jgi:predicted nucleotide-binding protein (sugar kinase/HSP70/actin superfamily)